MDNSRLAQTSMCLRERGYHIVQMVDHNRAHHFGGALSCTYRLAALFSTKSGSILRIGRMMTQPYFLKVIQQTPTEFWINNPTREHADLAIVNGVSGY